MNASSTVSRLLDLARWAPSGDNTQPWRFEPVGESSFVIHGFDTREHCVYDLDGHPSQLALGALIETLTIAATGLQLRAEVRRRGGLPDSRPTFEVTLVKDAALLPSALIASIPRRSVQRRGMSTRRLTLGEKQLLEQALPQGYSIRWLEGPRWKWRLALLLFHNAKIRLITEEAYQVHRSIISWGSRFSADRVPDQSLGADALTLRLMRWAMQDWSRVQFLNRYLAGTWLPRLLMDFMPALACAGHFILFRDREPHSVDDYVEAGRAVQRVWLTATQLGLQHQPEVTPLIFSRYVRDGVNFSASAASIGLARALAGEARDILAPEPARAVWIGRIGQGAAARSRSERRSTLDLTQAVPADAGAGDEVR